MNVKQQMHLDIKLYKIFNTCKLKGKWKNKNNSHNHDYIALENGSSIVLKLNPPNLTETFSFKKDANISIKDGLIGYHDKDLL